MTVDDEIKLIQLGDEVVLLRYELKALRDDIAELQTQYEALTSGENDTD